MSIGFWSGGPGLTRMEVHMSELRFWRGAAASRSQLTNDASTVGLRSTSPHISAQPSPASACSESHTQRRLQREVKE